MPPFTAAQTGPGRATALVPALADKWLFTVVGSRFVFRCVRSVFAGRAGASPEMHPPNNPSAPHTCALPPTCVLTPTVSPHTHSPHTHALSQHTLPPHTRAPPHAPHPCAPHARAPRHMRSPNTQRLPTHMRSPYTHSPPTRAPHTHELPTHAPHSQLVSRPLDPVMLFQVQGQASGNLQLLLPACRKLARAPAPGRSQEKEKVRWSTASGE